jgi:hypothetical protein
MIMRSVQNKCEYATHKLSCCWRKGWRVCLRAHGAMLEQKRAAKSYSQVAREAAVKCSEAAAISNVYSTTIAANTSTASIIKNSALFVMEYKVQHSDRVSWQVFAC